MEPGDRKGRPPSVILSASEGSALGPARDPSLALRMTAVLKFTPLGIAPPFPCQMNIDGLIRTNFRQVAVQPHPKVDRKGQPRRIKLRRWKQQSGEEADK